MRLLVDVGNTAVKVATEQGGQITMISEAAIPWQNITEVLIAQVGRNDDLAPILRQARARNIPHLSASVSATLGDLICAYPEFKNLGIDRWLTVVASYHLFPNKACVIVDSGTATKVDVLDDKGRHQGGWILPGLDMMIESLVSNTQQVFSDEHTKFDVTLGTNTPNAVKNAALSATVALAQQAITQVKQNAAAEQFQLIFAGGYGELIQQHLDSSGIYFDDLVMQGLVFWRKYQQNA
ncbi:pantothenate kinase [Pseudoalteromonas luteoviolacea]|uniref:Type III pantothenate kinase n=1 Tax=Pseudoalteromonas luteoviolacea TaxID=43657 RepID=A0A1C0TK76_9GAMM|nr:type III pantothenate kinase [Pseudoalteromonas luteoviolacea]OCQ18726.1 pantothenate kinase [Pseudoalteromonas luteoviolacea]